MRIYTDIDLCPNIQKFLPLMGENKMFYKYYNLKHPSALYNSSIGKIENSLKSFLNAYEIYEAKDFEKDEKMDAPDLLRNYKELLYCFREHLDDCFHLIKIFISPTQKKDNNRNQYKWLEDNATDLVQDLFKNISEYKKYLDASVNELKHNNATLCSVLFYNSKNKKEHCLGYFVANVINGAFEPIERVHAKFGNSYTGFSFKRDLTYNLFHIYNLSEEIMTFLTTKIGVDFRTLTPKVSAAPEDRKLIFKKLIDLPLTYFPDEYLKPVPSMSITKDERMKFEYPSHLSIKQNRLDRVMVTHSGDGHTNQFKIPYL